MYVRSWSDRLIHEIYCRGSTKLIGGVEVEEKRTSLARMLFRYHVLSRLGHRLEKDKTKLLRIVYGVIFHRETSKTCWKIEGTEELKWNKI